MIMELLALMIIIYALISMKKNFSGKKKRMMKMTMMMKITGVKKEKII